ncbi:sortase family protein [Anaerococcus hydrogenalis DSM 7454]|uniref:Sortase family protein n=1 Tax=Anaerococcus hydrogenalis DSM 7454 TaxID=561177 RepID=B6W6R9_9FIRM|nr:class C sortase [Anaerococcus hydrogenalis]EEB36859.1 sortase family protein [Anaerococcus hydrogenalis DSM 7454]
MNKNSTKKKSKIIGYILILLGLLTLAFPFSRRIYSNIENKSQIEKVIKAQKEDKQFDQIEKKAQEYNEIVKNSDISMVDPFTSKNLGSVNILENQDDIFAYLQIPKLDKNIPIYLNASYNHLAWGLGQVSGTSVPIGGESTRSVLAGHRGWWGDTMLLYADDLVKGDMIYVKRSDKVLKYSVCSKEVIGPYDWEKLKVIEGEDIITLLTCHPFIWPRPNRLLINAKRVEDKNKDPKDQIQKTEISKKVKITNYAYIGFLLIDLILIILVIRSLIKTIRK